MTPADIERMARMAAAAGLGQLLPAEAGLPGTWLGTNLECLERFAEQATAEAVAATRRACAQVAAAYGPSRPVLARHPPQLVRGRWEGEQAASAGIAAAILEMDKP